MGLAMLIMGACGALFVLMPAPLLRLFTPDAALVRAGTAALRLVGAAQLVSATGLTLAGALRGAGRTRAVMIVDVAAGLGLMPPLAWLFGIALGGDLLGATWAFVQPVLTILLYLFIYQVGFRAPPPSGVPFVVWLIVGMAPWFYFVEALSTTTIAFLEYGFLVKKVLFDGESVRHYMATRMPQYGTANLQHLPAVFARLDVLHGRSLAIPRPESRNESEREREKSLRAAGREDAVVCGAQRRAVDAGPASTTVAPPRRCRA